MKTSNLEELTHNKTLSIQVSLDGFSFYAKDEKNGFYEKISTQSIEDAGSPENLLRKIEKTFTEQNDLLQSFKTIDVVYRNELFTVVPAAFFEPERPADYLKYNTKILSTDFVVYDEIEPYELIVIYIPFANINNFFFDRYGSFSYHHHITLFLKEVLDAAVTGKKQVVVNLGSTNFDIIALEGKKMLLVNTFTYAHAEDFLYHILFCYEQLNFDPDYDPLTIQGNLDKDNACYQLAYTYIRNIILTEKTDISG